MSFCPELRALAVAGAMVGAGQARADPRLTLQWSAPEGCPDRGAVERRALELAGAAAVGPVSAAAVVEGEAGRLTLRLSTSRPAADDRSLVAPTCEEVAEAAAVILALALAPPTAPAKPTAVMDPPPAPSATPPRDRRAPAGATAPTRGLLGVAAVMEAGALPFPAGGGRLSLGVAHGRFRGDAIGTYLPGREARLPSGEGVDLQLLAGAARACVTAVRSVVEVSPCAGFEAGSLSGTGVGATSVNEGSAAWIAPSVGGIALVRLWRGTAIEGSVDAYVPLHHPRFVIVGVGGVHETPDIGARFGAGLVTELF